MRNNYFLLPVFLLISLVSYAQHSTYRFLKKIPHAQVDIKDTTGTGFKGCWILTIEQELDHTHHSGKNFKQRIFISEKDPHRPVIFVTEGYDASYAKKKGYKDELSKLYDANLVVVEHRYFGESVPDSMDYRYLNLEQATADYNVIRQLLSPVFKGKWISTGVSKGGQTALAYKAYYPDDVDVTVAYVAPVNRDSVDPRIPVFLNRNDIKECREKIIQFQKECLQQKDTLLSLYKSYAGKRKYTFSHDPEIMFEYQVLEYPFSFWQWGHGVCDSIPFKEATPEKMLSHLLKNVPLWYYTSDGIQNLEPFFYQAYTELGFYEYDPEPFKTLLSQSAYPNNFFAPKNTNLKFNPEPMKKIDRYLSERGNHIIYISGSLDPWGATAYTPPQGIDALKVVRDGGSHTTRISNLSPSQKKEVFNALQRWVDESFVPVAVEE